MPSIEELPPPLAAYRDATRARIGQRTRHDIGVIDERLIRRYALSIGDMDPIRHDHGAACAAGYAAVVAPPNLLAGVVDWGAGRAEDELGPDGTSRQAATGALRVMGAGEEMEIEREVVAGVHLFEDSGVESVEVKHGRSGPLLFVTSSHDFVDGEGRLFSRNRRTVMVRA